MGDQLVLSVGLVGVGFMGSGMAINLAKSPHKLTMCDLNIDVVHQLKQRMLDEGVLQAANEQKVTVVANAAEVMRSSDIVLMSLNSEKAGEAVLFGENGVVSVGESACKGKVVVDLGTVSPEYNKAMCKRLQEAGVGYLDAPVSGGPGGALAGTLSVMVGGDLQVFERCKPALQSIGSYVVHMGPIGAGTAAKLVNQLLVTVNTVAACEAYQFAKALGVANTGELLELLKVSWGQSRMVEKNLGDLMRAEKDGEEALMRSAAPIRNLKKDIDIIRAAAGKCGVALPTLEPAAQCFDQAVAKGLEGADLASITILMEK